MPGQAGPNLGLKWGWTAGENGWGADGFNPNTAYLDTVISLSVLSATVAVPPGSPAAGDRYIVGPAPSGTWAGKAGQIAVFRDAAWAFYPPRRGWRAEVQDAGKFVSYGASAWADEPVPTHTHQVTGIEATGTPDATKFLRGDGAWATPPAGGGGGAVAVQDEGTEIAAAASAINFTGAGVTVTAGVGGAVEVAIPGGSGGGGGTSSLAGADDAAIAAPATGESLVYSNNDAKWHNKRLALAGTIAGTVQTPAPTTLNAADKGAGITLSNGDLTLTAATPAGDELVRSVGSVNAGKVYFEFQGIAFSGGDSNVGFATAAATGPGMGGFGTEAAVVFGGFSGNIYVNGAGSGRSLGTIGSGLVAVAADFTAKLIWFRKYASGTWGNWNNNAAADPATGAGGISIASLTGPFYAAAAVSAGSTNAGTFNFGGSAFTGAVPAGFSAGPTSGLQDTPADVPVLADVEIVAPAQGHGLFFDAAADKWKNAALPVAPVPSIATANDVALASPASGSALVFDATTDKWVNKALSLTGTVPTPPAYDTLSPEATDAGLTLSNGNLTVTGTGQASHAVSRGNTAKSAGKAYFEFRIPTFTFNIGAGLSPASATATQLANAGQNGILLTGRNDGQCAVLVNAQQGAILPSPDGKVCSIAIDLGAQLVWFRVDGGTWNGSGTADPAAGTGGFSTAAVPGPLFPTGVISSGAFTFAAFNFGASPFAFAVPSGFNAGWETAASRVPQAVMSDVQVTAPADKQGLFFDLGTGTWKNASVTVDRLSATGTPDATKFLRGDGAWATNAAGQVSWAVPWRGATLQHAGGAIVPPLNLSFTAEKRDTDGFHDGVTNPTRLTVPAGVSKVRLRGAAQATAVTASNGVVLQFQKNGSVAFDGNVASEFASAPSFLELGASIETAILDVVPGDYFEVRLACQDTAITLDANRTWFEIEVIESDAQPFAVVDAPADGKFYYRRNGAWTLGPQEVSLFIAGLMATGNALVASYLFSRPVTLRAGLADSIAFARVASTGAASLPLKMNETTIVGSVDFADGATLPTLFFPADVTFARGDRLNVYTPGSPNATLADTSLTFVGERS